jgi:16S rRNA (guanine527-N7)-methyltransferase
MGTPVSERAVRSMLRHLDILSQWNVRVNLSAIRRKDDMAVRHVLDSLSVFKVIEYGAGLRALDVGSGAGFPGLTLKAADESLKLSLLDRDARKIAFLKVASKELGLEGNRFFLMDVSRLAENPAYHGAFDVVVTRGLAVDEAMFEAFRLLIGPSGGVVRMLGPRTAQSERHPGWLTPAAQWEGRLPFSRQFRKLILLTPRD